MCFRASLLFVIVLTWLQLGCTTTRTEPQYAGAAIIPPLQTPNQKTPVRLGRGSILWGKHDSVHGFDTSFIGNIVNKDFKGSAVSGVFHSTDGTAEITPLQLSGLINLNHGKTSLTGAQVSFGINYAGGSQSVYGLQLAGLANLGMKNKLYGFQIGLYNEAEAIYGFQIGLLNRTKNLYGLQIGLLNLSSNNGLPFSPILNIGF